MRLRAWWITGLCALGVARAEQAGQVRFTPPPGWTLKMQGGVAQLTPQNLPLGETAFLTVGMGTDFAGDFAAWFEKVTGGVPQGYRVKRSDVVKSKDANGVPLLGRSVTLQNGAGEQFYLFYVGANPRGRAELLFFTASSLETFRKYQPGLNTLTASVQFLGASGAPQAARTGAGAVAAPTGGGLPALPAPKLTALLAQGLDPDKQPIPDEFRCYPEVGGDQWQKPVFALQILPNGQYRVPGSTGTYTMKQDSSLTYVQFRSGALQGTDDSYLNWDKKYGQSIEIQNYPLKNGDSIDINCYQRGAREALARDLFRRKDPQPGKYPCRSTDGKNTDMGTLELLPGRQYRYKGQTGKYTVGVLLDQDKDYTGPWMRFSGGVLDDNEMNYFEKEDGEREVEFLRNGRCLLVVGPMPMPKFGAEKAPAPPKGYGGIGGNYFINRQQFIGGFIKYVPFFYFFDKSGYVYTDDPDEGMEETDCSRTYPSGMPVCELYRAQGGQLTIGSDKPVPYKLAGGKLTLNGEELTAIAPVSGLKLGGVYKKTTAFTATLGTGGGLWEDFLTFNKDGTFRREKSGGVSITTTTDGTSFGDPTAFVGTSSERRNGGKYAFQGNTLTLTYGDGRVERLFAFLPEQKGGKPDLEWLQLAGGDYFLQDAKK